VANKESEIHLFLLPEKTQSDACYSNNPAQAFEVAAKPLFSCTYDIDGPLPPLFSGSFETVFERRFPESW
jgi:hypothetical protein